jgi:hypothetical protein
MVAGSNPVAPIEVKAGFCKGFGFLDPRSTARRYQNYLPSGNKSVITGE